MLKPEIARFGANMLILGDVNARTAERDDYINEIRVVPTLRHYEEYLQDDIFTKRASCDTHTNKFGLELIEFCRTYMVHICNGRYDEDKGIGHYTFTGPNGNSVIDYAICSNKLAYLIDKFKVEERTESSHFPISVGLRCRLQTETVDLTNRTKKYMKTNYLFNDITSTQYHENLDSVFTNEFVHSFVMEIEDNTNTIDSIAERFTNILKDCGKCCKRRLKANSNKQPKWFDETCKQLKTDKYNLLREYRRGRNENNLIAYKQGRNRFKSRCKTQRKLHNKKVLDDLVSDSKNPKSFWNKLKNICNSRHQRQNNITKDQWKSHFEKLFNDNTRNENIDNIMHEDEIEDVFQYDLTENELEDIIFNSEITNEEVLKSIQALKCGKSAGTDEIIPEFFIHSVDNILPLLNRFFNRMFDKAEFPNSWCNSIIVTLYKKGDANSPDNYRGISLLNIFSKIYTSIISRRVTFYTNIYNKISESQAGFREGYSTIDNAFILYSLIHKYLSKKTR